VRMVKNISNHNMHHSAVKTQTYRITNRGRWKSVQCLGQTQTCGSVKSYLCSRYLNHKWLNKNKQTIKKKTSTDSLLTP
jgi:hypothetical protein